VRRSVHRAPRGGGFHRGYRRRRPVTGARSKRPRHPSVTGVTTNRWYTCLKFLARGRLAVHGRFEECSR
jgi:hypothetical protein